MDGNDNGNDIVNRLRQSRTVRRHELDGAELVAGTEKWICVDCGVAVTYADEKPDCSGFGGYLEWEAADEIERLQAENARLRSLIAAWADAEDEADMIRGIDLFTAYEALRKAVGR